MEYSCAILFQNKKTFLGKRAHYRATYANCWDFIGGKIEPNERKEDALTRELNEEVGITPTEFTYFESILDYNISHDTPPTYHFFTVTQWDGGEPTICNHEHSEARWFNLEEACKLRDLVMPEYVGIFQRAFVALS